MPRVTPLGVRVSRARIGSLWAAVVACWSFSNPNEKAPERMKIEKSFNLPEFEPVVPDKLAEFVTTYLPGTNKIHVLVYSKGGWSKANGITVEDGDDPSDVYSMVKACADHHCEEPTAGTYPPENKTHAPNGLARSGSPAAPSPRY